MKRRDSEHLEYERRALERRSCDIFGVFQIDRAADNSRVIINVLQCLPSFPKPVVDAYSK